MIFNFKSTSDAKTLEGKKASDFFPKTGGDINGNITQIKTGESDYTTRRIQNPARSVYERVAPNGQYCIFDDTNKKYIIDSSADGTAIFNGTASGNLKLDGGGTVKTADSSIMAVENTSGNTSLIRYRGTSGILGYLGYSGVDKPVVYSPTIGTKEILHLGNMASHVLVKNNDNHMVGSALTPLIVDTTHSENDFVRIGFYRQGVVRGLIGMREGRPTFTDTSYVNYTIHHDGNSAKVVISQTAPSDTAALWVY